jgi:hypothetical protein
MCMSTTVLLPCKHPKVSGAHNWQGSITYHISSLGSVDFTQDSQPRMKCWWGPEHSGNVLRTLAFSTTSTSMSFQSKYCAHRLMGSYEVPHYCNHLCHTDSIYTSALLQLSVTASDWLFGASQSHKYNLHGCSLSLYAPILMLSTDWSVPYHRNSHNSLKSSAFSQPLSTSFVAPFVRNHQWLDSGFLLISWVFRNTDETLRVKIEGKAFP